MLIDDLEGLKVVMVGGSHSGFEMSIRNHMTVSEMGLP
jgi:hypothetical protein